MILAMRDPRAGVHECHGLVVVLELERLLDHAVLVFPTGQTLEHVPDLSWRHRCHPGLAGLALLPCQSFRYLAHGCYLKVKRETHSTRRTRRKTRRYTKENQKRKNAG